MRRKTNLSTDQHSAKTVYRKGRKGTGKQLRKFDDPYVYHAHNGWT